MHIFTIKNNVYEEFFILLGTTYYLWKKQSAYKIVSIM